MMSVNVRWKGARIIPSICIHRADVLGVFCLGKSMKAYAERFYKSKAWQNCRREYVKSAGGLCEECLKEGRVTVGVIVHHINHVSPDNIQDPSVLLNFDNLELVCRDCHAKMHRAADRRFEVDELGRVTPL